MAAPTNKVPFQVGGDNNEEDPETNKVPFQVEDDDNDDAAAEDSETKKVPFQEGNILHDEATAERILQDYILLANRVQLHKCCQY